jgi:phosphoribosylformylglycinamidine synthase
MDEKMPTQIYSISGFPFENFEPEIEQYLQRLFTTTEHTVLKQVWDDYYRYLFTHKYLFKFFHVLNQKFENKINLSPSVQLQLTPYLFALESKYTLSGEIAPPIESLKLQLITQSFSPISLILSGIFGNPIPSDPGCPYEKLFSLLGNETNPLGIPTYPGDLKFTENISQSTVLNFLGIGICSHIPDLPKNNVILLLSDKKDENFATSVPSASPANLFFQIRLKQFIQETNKTKIHIFDSFQVKSGLYASAFIFAHFLQKGITIDSTEILPQKNTLLLTCDIALLEQIDILTNKWGLEYTKIGKVVQDHTFKVKANTIELAELPLHTFSFLLKHIEIPDKPPTHKKEHLSFAINHMKEPGDYRDTAWNLITNPNLKSKDWLMEKFDSTVGMNNIHLNFPASSCVLNIHGTENALSVSAFNESSYFKIDPEKGSYIAIGELTRKITCSGAISKVITPCFLLPYNQNKDQADKMQGIIKGLFTAARYFSLQISEPSIAFVDNNQYEHLDLPFVSLFCTGILADKNHMMTAAFKNKGDMIYLIGKSTEDIQSSFYLRNYHQVDCSNPPHFDLQDELNIQAGVKKIIHKNLVRSANSISMGGLFKSLTDSAIIKNYGFDITTDAEIRKDAFLFGESQSRIIVSVTPHHETEFIDSMVEIGVPFSALGHVTKEEIRIDDISYGFVSDFQKEYFTSPK